MTAIPLSAGLPTVRLYLIEIDIRLVPVKPYHCFTVYLRISLRLISNVFVQFFCESKCPDKQQAVQQNYGDDVVQHVCMMIPTVHHLYGDEMQ